MSVIDIDMSQFASFFERVNKAAQGDFKKELQLFLEGLGTEFLRVVQDEIKRRKVMDTRLLLNSFQEGGDGSVWSVRNGGLTLEIGSSVNYAAHVNGGHWTNPKGVDARFVPGDVVLDANGKVVEFTYNPNAKSGIMLKQKWVEGAHYWESALKILDKLYPTLLEKKLQAWLDSYFS